MDKYIRVVRELQEMITVGKQATGKACHLEDKLEYQRLVKKLQQALSAVRLCYFDYENADNLANR